MIIILPMSRPLYKYLDDLETGSFGQSLLSIVLTGFLNNMMVRNFDLKSHLFDVDYIDGLYGSECTDIKQAMSMVIAKMTIAYRTYFPHRKYTDISIRRATYTRSSLRFSIEVPDERR
ncbi:hypothetical protein DTU56_24940 [Salmonella enterica subsp. enterica serovar Muenchen]|uniref:Uncharacterized protein n=1 Tax=Salmonella muenchen TaxID=596 RepID=A0A5U8XTR7_SALMU|nr:hypothetical protein [Salmonella enterica subsp. enterica serovar Muenchen]QFP93233.1 hypothetical protein [Serratia phage PCH45]